MGTVILLVLVMNGWGDGIPETAPEVQQRSVWNFRGTKDPKLIEAMNAHLLAAQSAYDEDGQALSDIFGVKYQPNYTPFFYDSDQNVGIRNLRKKKGAFAITEPNSRVLWFPGSAASKLDPETSRNLILHEVMHSLGLKEDGSNESDKITKTIFDYYKNKKKKSP